MLTLKAARVNANYGQKEAASSLGISNKTLSNWENGYTVPKQNYIDAICKLYGVSYDNLIFLPSDSLKAD
ncbi:MAG: helix-turn-helix domain-containing protein [Oscillospiraceae bacterium]